MRSPKSEVRSPKSPEKPENGWGEYKHLILSEIQRLASAVSSLDGKFDGYLIARSELQGRVIAAETRIETIESDTLNRRTDLKWLLGTVIGLAALLIAIFRH